MCLFHHYSYSSAQPKVWLSLAEASCMVQDVGCIPVDINELLTLLLYILRFPYHS